MYFSPKSCEIHVKILCTNISVIFLKKSLYKNEIGWIRTNDEKSIDLQSIALTTQPLFLLCVTHKCVFYLLQFFSV